MSGLLIPNFAFEDSINERKQNSPKTQQAQQDLAPLMAWLAGPNDVVRISESELPEDLPEPISHTVFRATPNDTVFRDIRPWGWDFAARKLVNLDSEAPQQIPSVAAVAAANSRSFNTQHDKLLNHSHLEVFPHGFSQFCSTYEQWKIAVQRIMDFGFDQWVAKAEFSHAGRNRLLVTGRQLNDQQSGWLKRQLEGNGVAVEPWVQRIREYSLQFELQANHRIKFLGVTQLINDSMGRYRGTKISKQVIVPSEWFRHAETVCQSILQLGYFGPVGIDGFTFAHRGQTAIRPCNDINARHTMGRLALHVAERLGYSDGFWRQIVPNKSRTANFQDELAFMQSVLTTSRWKDVVCHRTSSFLVGCRPIRLGTVFFTSPEFQSEEPTPAIDFDQFLASLR